MCILFCACVCLIVCVQEVHTLILTPQFLLCQVREALCAAKLKIRQGFSKAKSQPPQTIQAVTRRATLTITRAHTGTHTQVHIGLLRTHINTLRCDYTQQL